MGKVSKVIDMWVVVEPRGLGDYGFCSIGAYAVKDNVDEYKRRCDEIVSDIRRHVDNVGSARTHIEREEVCEFCGHAWTEDDSSYNGGCCGEDEERHKRTDDGGE